MGDEEVKKPINNYIKKKKKIRLMKDLLRWRVTSSHIKHIALEKLREGIKTENLVSHGTKPYPLPPGKHSNGSILLS